MSRLKTLYFNVDTLYPKIWTAEFERELLTPLVQLHYVPEVFVNVQWEKPVYDDATSNWFEEEIGRPLLRGESLKTPDEINQIYPEASDMRIWIIKTVQALDEGGL